ncbi:MAG TPA: helix-turn-helix transcriptional regulator [Thermoanaerobaculia bacterium]|nr:helix-turn-helix transcriptional regulator [Thermoanaerobaculia bacterium]
MAQSKNVKDGLRLVTVFLRFQANMTQAELGKACGIQQGDISRYESGGKVPSEGVLRRMAAAAAIPWPVAAHIRRFLSKVLSTTERWIAAESGAESVDRTAVEVALLTFAYELIEADLTAPFTRTPEETRREAEVAWLGLEALPMPRRRRMIELSLRSSRNWALAVRICGSSERAAAADPEEAIELAELALSIAEQVPGDEGWRSRVKGYVYAHLANARRAAGDPAGAGEALAQARDLWQASTDPEGLIPEPGEENCKDFKDLRSFPSTGTPTP